MKALRGVDFTKYALSTISAYHGCNTLFHWLETHHVQVPFFNSSMTGHHTGPYTCPYMLQCPLRKIAQKAQNYVSLANKICGSLISTCKLMQHVVIQTLRFIALWLMDGWVRVLRPFNSISVILRRWKGEHERLCAMKRRLGSGRISPPAGFEPVVRSRKC